ncbi:MAG TPA: putative peptidoglycan glycosyltransferase FtsW [Candidatus Limnocylindria bacterium]|nr:putative peptidoglycan glycosyltransferase FtsW [Candidatus Limnocylindria bacterium]
MSSRRPLLSSRGAVQRKHKPDYILILISILLLAVGLIVVYAISPGLSAQRRVGENYFVTKQLTAISLGIIAFLVVAFVPFRKWYSWQRPLLVLAVVATLVALVTPVSPDYPAHRWIRFAGLSLQSVELVKIALIICLAAFLERRIQLREAISTQKTLKPLIIVLGAVGLAVAILQRDFGSTAVITGMMAAMAFVAGLPLVRVAQVGVVVVLALLVLILPFGYRRDRITTFLNPEKDCQSAGYQACQALIAVGSGGLFGIGLQNSGQAFGYLPEAANDSIFAIVSEKFGFVGATFLVCLFAVFFARIKNIMERAPDNFSRLIVAGVLAWFSTQTFINIGAMIGLLPLKGITLPFISTGGTSVVFLMAGVGLVFNISRYTSYAVNRGDDDRTLPERGTNDHTADWRRNRRPHYADSSPRP